jgi:hypothetical protein
VRLVLTAALALETRAMGSERESRIELVFEPNGGKTRIQIEKIMNDYHVRSALDISQPAPDGTARAALHCRLHRRHHLEFLGELAALKEVKEIKELAQ